MSNEDLKLAESVVYDAAAREVTVALKDGSRHAWPVRLLEMVKRSPEGWVPLENISNQQLSAVEIYGGGQYILWDELDQAFRIADLLAGIYGREAWMKALMATSE